MPEEELTPEVETVETPETDQAVEVDITEKPKEEAKPKEEGKKPEPLAFDERKLHNLVGFQVRQQMKIIEQKLEDLAHKIQPTQQQVDESQLDEIDKEAQVDWKKAVRKLGRQEAEQYVKEYLEKQQVSEAQNYRSQLVERSKSFVLSQYPQLADDSSDEAKVFTQVWNENQSLWSNPEGYRLAMYEMEERMRSSGRTPNRVKQEVDKEVRRQLRANASGVVGNRSQGSNKVMLTKEQLNICEQLGIKPEDYARTMKSLENKEDITV